VILPGLDVAVYEVITEPPLLPGAVNGTVAVVPEIVAVPIVGAPGTVNGVALLLAALAEPVPTEFVAVTVNVYAVPLDNPDTLIGDVALVPVIPLGLDVAVKVVMLAPPLLAGAVNVTATV
jgi:hypothetical protein